MAVTSHATGTQSATVTTEHFLSSPNVAGTFTLHVDCNALVNGDIVVLRAYQMVLTGGTSRVVYEETISGAVVSASNEKIYITVPISNELTDTNALRFSLTQTQGTGRSFPWKVLKYA